MRQKEDNRKIESKEERNERKKKIGRKEKNKTERRK
jgi:hypothetical protein